MALGVTQRHRECSKGCFYINDDAYLGVKVCTLRFYISILLGTHTFQGSLVCQARNTEWGGRSRFLGI